MHITYQHRKTWVYNDINRRSVFINKEFHKLLLKGMKSNFINANMLTVNLFNDKRILYFKLFHKNSIGNNISSFRNGCLRSGKGRSVMRLFKYSRHESKRLFFKGYLMGVRKSSF